MEVIKTIKCSDPYTDQKVWNGKVIIKGGSIEGIAGNDIDITYINGHILVNGIALTLIKSNSEEELYSLVKVNSKDNTDYFEGTLTNDLGKQFARCITLEEDNMLAKSKIKGLKKQISDYKKSNN